MTQNSFIGRWKGHCYCPTSPLSSRGISTAHGDYRRRMNPLSTFCFVYFIFSSPPVCSAVNIWKGEIVRKWDLLSICCTQVLASRDFKSHHSALKWSLKRDICFFFLAFFFLFSCFNYSSVWEYLTPCKMTGLDFFSLIGSGVKSFVSSGGKMMTSNAKQLPKLWSKLINTYQVGPHLQTVS